MISRIKVLVGLFMALGLTVACTDDKPKEVVDPVSATEPTAPAIPDAPAPVAAASADLGASTIFFAYDDYSLSTEAQSELSKVGEYLKGNPNAVVQVEGHCDERGTVEYNLALGERRAQSVKSYLVNLGVTDARLTTISYGEEKPSIEGHDESAWSKNRRAGFILTVK